jgi:hypothetical protein
MESKKRVYNAVVDPCFKKLLYGLVFLGVVLPRLSMDHWPFKMKVTSSFETSGAAYLAIQHHIPEGRNPQLYDCENFKTRTLFFHLPGETTENHVECFQDIWYKRRDMSSIFAATLV